MYFFLHYRQSEQYKIWERTIIPSLPSDFRNYSQAERQNYIDEKSAIQNFKKFKAETAKNIPALNLLDLISFFDRCRGDVRSATLVG